MRTLDETIQAFITPLKRRILSMFARAVITEINDAGGIQIVKVDALADETREVERFGSYGFTSNPPADSEAIVAFLGGNRAQGVIVGIENRTARLKNLETGEAALYTDENSYLKLARDKELHIRADKLKVVGESEELMDLLIQVSEQLKDIANKLSTDTTNTIFGPMKLNGFAYYALREADLTTLITKLEAMKAT